MSDISLLENKLIVFKIQKEEYAVSVKNVGSIERLLPITRVPSTASFVKGVINLRGIVTPVVDLKERFYHVESEFTNQTRIIIVHMDDISVGLIVEEANDVVDINKDQIEPAPEVVGSKVDDYISGVIKLDKRLLLLLDLEKVLSKEELIDLKVVEG